MPVMHDDSDVDAVVVRASNSYCLPSLLAQIEAALGQFDPFEHEFIRVRVRFTTPPMQEELHGLYLLMQDLRGAGYGWKYSRRNGGLRTLECVWDVFTARFEPIDFADLVRGNVR